MVITFPGWVNGNDSFLVAGSKARPVLVGVWLPGTSSCRELFGVTSSLRGLRAVGRMVRGHSFLLQWVLLGLLPTAFGLARMGGSRCTALGLCKGLASA